MKDSLKNFVDQHRDEFDNKQPSDRVWSGIETRLPVKHTLWGNINIWRAAAVVFLSLSVFLLVTGNFPTKQRERAQLQREFNDLEKFYTSQIEDKVELISTIKEFNDEETFVQDIQKLDAMYQVLREQMKTNPSEKIKDALILNMLVRIDLLNQQIKSLEDSKEETGEVTI